MLVNVLIVAILLIGGAIGLWRYTGEWEKGVPFMLMACICLWMAVTTAYYQIPRTVSVTIRKGRHSPPWWWRLLHLRVWLFRVPTGYCIEDFQYKIAGEKGENIVLVVDVVKDAALWTQINKVGGLAWGMPRKTKNGKSWHPNSDRLGFALNGNGYHYYYHNGEHGEENLGPISPTFEMYADTLLSKKRLAYYLMPYIGGEIPAPCDIRISYTITFLF